MQEINIYNSHPEEYLQGLGTVLANVEIDGNSPSNRVIEALRLTYPDVRTTGFKKEVLKAILEDACAEVTPEWRKKYLRRLRRWTGPNYQDYFYERFEILASWKQRYRLVPDAYLIDMNNKIIICFEVEDQHHLSSSKIENYGGAWWCLEYIYWDLYLISYDIYGNPRVITLPESSFEARRLLDTKELKKKHLSTLQSSSELEM